MEKTNQKRIFISIPVPTEIIPQVNRIKDQFNPDLKIPWIPEENLHMTLYFMGETPVEQIKPISKKIHEITSKLYEFMVYSGTPEIKEKGEKRGLIWLEIKKDENVRLLHHQILTELSWLPRVNLHASFKPHITISRYKPHRSGSLKSISLPPVKFSFPVKKIQLMESILANEGAVYKVLESFSLQTRK